MDAFLSASCQTQVQRDVAQDPRSAVREKAVAEEEHNAFDSSGEDERDPLLRH